MMRNSISEQFKNRFTVSENGCWIWTGARFGDYGVIHSWIDGKKLTIGAHRASYEVHKGPIPDGLVIDHLCSNPICVNPDHLRAVTFKENVLRGNAMSARHARAATCERGHPKTPSNRYVNSDGRERCRLCRNITNAARKARLRENPMPCKECNDTGERPLFKDVDLWDYEPCGCERGGNIALASAETK